MVFTLSLCYQTCKRPWVSLYFKLQILYLNNGNKTNVTKFTWRLNLRSIVPWLCDFLSNRMQCVRYNSTLSDFATLSAGLPQGTKLGPIGFQVIINDALQNNSGPISCWIYVDDLKIAENRTPPDSSQLQVILDSYSQWTENNSLSLNPAKCQAL